MNQTLTESLAGPTQTLRRSGAPGNKSMSADQQRPPPGCWRLPAGCFGRAGREKRVINSEDDREVDVTRLCYFWRNTVCPICLYSLLKLNCIPLLLSLFFTMACSFILAIE